METEYNMEAKAGYNELLAKIKATVTPVEIAAEAGDCCFWHPRSAHSAGMNTSSHLRIVVPCDFQQDKPTEEKPPYSGFSLRQAKATGKSLSPEPSGMKEELRLQWWIDTREFSAPDSPPRPDMWEDWEI
jgi:ectoine hydroxylase-related dioxygenase (phytanoyl-CoA dioxygenase family)